MSYTISSLHLPKGGTLGIAPVPSPADIEKLIAWKPGAILSMTTAPEMPGLNFRARFGAIWHHLPIDDFGIPDTKTNTLWREVSPQLHVILDRQGRIFAHCLGGKGRSGMILLRLMVERGNDPGEALSELRAIRPGAVETEAQRLWAINPD